LVRQLTKIMSLALCNLHVRMLHVDSIQDRRNKMKYGSDSVWSVQEGDSFAEGRRRRCLRQHSAIRQNDHTSRLVARDDELKLSSERLIVSKICK
jgi:hypothetical protein